MKTLLLAAAAITLLPLASAGEISVSFSDDFTEKLTEDYGEREGDVLSERIVKDLNRAFDKAGVAPARVEVTILDAKPNRPTIGQLGDRPGLSYSGSISIGGMDLVGTAYDAEGNTLGSEEYSWYENSIADVFGNGTWSDARRVSRRFADKLVDEIRS